MRHDQLDANVLPPISGCTSWSPTSAARCTTSESTWRDQGPLWSESPGSRSRRRRRSTSGGGSSTWDLGDLPQVVESGDRALDVLAYPTLLDVGDSVALRVVTSPERAGTSDARWRAPVAAARRRADPSVRRGAAHQRRSVGAGACRDVGRRAGRRLHRRSGRPCAARARHAALDRSRLRRAAGRRCAAVTGPRPPGVDEGCVGRGRFGDGAVEAGRRCAPRPCVASVDDANLHLGRLVRPGFVLSTGLDQLDEIERYVRAIEYRLDHLAGAVERDQRRMARGASARTALSSRFVDRLPAGAATPEVLAVALAARGTARQRVRPAGRQCAAASARRDSSKALDGLNA